MTHIRKHERPTTTAAGGGLRLRLLLLLSAATDVVRATDIPLLVDDERLFLPETTTVTPEFSIATATTRVPDSSFGAGFLCGNSLTELETTCGTAKNCFSDPCPPETPFCFPFQCKKTGDASTATTMSTNTAATTTAARFLCANSPAELETTCGTAKDCFSDPCPSEAPFCFPFQCTTTSYASTAAMMTTTAETSTTAATTTADATTTTDMTTTDMTTTETSTTAATTTADATTTGATTTEISTTATTTTADATTTTDTMTTETSTTAATTTADATTTDMTTTEASTTAATKPPTYFYPQTFEGNTFCFSGVKTSIAALADMTPDEQESFLSLTMCECCSKHKCAMGSGMCPTIGPTTFVTTTTDATTTVASTTDASTTAATTPADATTTDVTTRGSSTTAATTTANATTTDASTTAATTTANATTTSTATTDASTTAATTTANATTTNTTTAEESTTAATTTADATTTDSSTTAATTTTNATTTDTTTTAARDAECQTEPFSVKVGTSCTEFFHCEGGRIIETKACPAGMRFNGRICDSAANVDCEPDPDCRMKPNHFSAKVSTGCRDYVFCVNGLLVETVTCPDGLLFNGMYCDLAQNVYCTLDGLS